jgi:hypothetical protein
MTEESKTDMAPMTAETSQSDAEVDTTYQSDEQAAVMLQRLLRGYLERNRLKQGASAMVIQKGFRCHLTKKRKQAVALLQSSLLAARERWRFLESLRAVATVQKVTRQWLGRRLAHRSKAALCLQHAWRQRTEMRQQRLEHTTMVTILAQNCARSYIDKANARRAAMTKLQSAWRSKRCKRVQSATRLQSAVRGVLARRRLLACNRTSADDKAELEPETEPSAEPPPEASATAEASLPWLCSDCGFNNEVSPIACVLCDAVRSTVAVQSGHAATIAGAAPVQLHPPERQATATRQVPEVSPSSAEKQAGRKSK